jgi:hypothetical protein
MAQSSSDFYKGIWVGRKQGVPIGFKCGYKVGRAANRTFWAVVVILTSLIAFQLGRITSTLF